jgi:hypothetical protein
LSLTLNQEQGNLVIVYSLEKEKETSVMVDLKERPKEKLWQMLMYPIEK